MVVELAVADSCLSHYRQTPEGWRNDNASRADTNTHTHMESAEDQFYCINSHVEPRGHMHESVCVHHLDYLTWSSSIT